MDGRHCKENNTDANRPTLTMVERIHERSFLHLRAQWIEGLQIDWQMTECKKEATPALKLNDAVLQV